MDILPFLTVWCFGCLYPLFVPAEFQIVNDTQDLDQDDPMLRENILEKILANYDKRFPPLYNKKTPVEVKVQMYVVGIFGIDESQMKYSMSMYLRQQWTDSRLQYNASEMLKQIELDNAIKKEIWVPDLSFMTDMDTKFHEVTVPNKMMFLYPSGLVSYSTRVTGTFTCFMKLQEFPFDKQLCVMELESCPAAVDAVLLKKNLSKTAAGPRNKNGYTANTISFRWIDPAMTFKEGIVHSQFEIGDPESYVCDRSYPSGNYTCIGVTIPLTRRYGFYMIQVFAPSVLIVMLSWVSFWLNIDAAPARVSLGILTVLTISTNGNLSVGMSQQVSYIRAIDIWNVVCLLLVFGAMIEYAYVCMIARVQKRRRERQTSEPYINGFKDIESNQISQETVEDNKLQHNRDLARKIDKASRVVFPLLFVIFNVVYWTYYII